MLSWGKTDEENKEKFGILTNYFEGNLTNELLVENNIPSFVYTIDSVVLGPDWEGTNAQKIHNLIVHPGLRELKGFNKFYVYDCQHHLVKKEIEGPKTALSQLFASCSDQNKDKIPSFTIFR